MKALLVDGFAEACRGLGAALRLFWPVLAAFAALYAVWFYFDYSAAATVPAPTEVPIAFQLSIIVIFLCAGFYMFFMLCQGAVGWHRRLLLEEQPGWISPLPRRRAFGYALAVFLFGLVYLITHMIVGFFTLPFLHSVFASSFPQVDLSGASVDQREAWRQAVRPIQLAMLGIAVVLFSTLLWLTKSWLLVFPHIALRTTQPPFGLIREKVTVPEGLIGALLLSYFLPTLPEILFDLFVPINVQFPPWVWNLFLVFQFVLSALSFLAGLSILSIAYWMAGVDRIPYERRERAV